MILQDLAKLYDQLVNDENPEISPLGFSKVNINFLLNLGSDGELLDILYVFVEKEIGKKKIELAQKRFLPEEVIRPGNVVANLLWDNKTYVLGIRDENVHEEDCKRKFEAFRKKNLEFIEKLSSPEAVAFKNFLERYSQDDFETMSLVQSKREEMLKATGNLTFQFEPTKELIANSAEIWQAVSNLWNAPKPDSILGQCLITGKIAPVQRIHPRIKGMEGVQSSGGAIVSFKSRAYESYGKEQKQGLNAPVSEMAAFAYTAGLNYLLSGENPHKKIQMADTTVVYWAEGNNPAYADLFQAMLNPDWSFDRNPEEQTQANKTYDNEMTEVLAKIARTIQDGTSLDFRSLNTGLDSATTFHVLGLAPNAARISIRFYEKAAFSKIIAKLVQHHEDISMGQERPWSVWRILKETISPKASKQEASPLLAGALMRSILTGLPYPVALYYAILNRVRADNDDPSKGVYKVSALKAGIIKACLLRKYRNQGNNDYQEVLTMSLNSKSDNQAYLLGRLFAVLEKAQEDAARPATLNATIKDRYFTAACANPASIFPVLLRLSHYYFSKSDWGKSSERRVGEIMELLEIDKAPFPKRLNMDEQGVFILGYYHQRNDFYKSRKNEIDENLEPIKGI